MDFHCCCCCCCCKVVMCGLTHSVAGGVLPNSFKPAPIHMHPFTAACWLALGCAHLHLFGLISSHSLLFTLGFSCSCLILVVCTHWHFHTVTCCCHNQYFTIYLLTYSYTWLIVVSTRWSAWRLFTLFLEVWAMFKRRKSTVKQWSGDQMMFGRVLNSDWKSHLSVLNNYTFHTWYWSIKA